jgi:capsular polysaccharide transport system permease protein
MTDQIIPPTPPAGRPGRKLRRASRATAAAATVALAAPRARGGTAVARNDLTGEGALDAPSQARAAPETTVIRIRPMARPARFRLRHKGLVLAFFIMVIGPIAAAVWYLETRAVDQYASTLGFTVRSEEGTSASDLLGGLGSTLGVSGPARDSDILYEFIRSQQLAATIDARLDLRGHYAAHVAQDPVFSLDPSGTVEDLTSYWQRMVRVSYDAGSGLMELRILAFTPEMAQAIAQAIFEESSVRINTLSGIAREDATRYAREDLDLAVERLKEAREALTAFRIENQIVDLNADVQGQMGLLNTLQAQLANSLIELDLLRTNAGEGDPRLSQAEARIGIIEARIEDERRKFGSSGTLEGDPGYATTVAEFERLTVDREFAEQGYLRALSAYDAARAQANRQSRYLAAYIQPTLAEASEFPQRPVIIGLVGLFAFLIWSILSLVFYALRDRH